MSDIKSRFLDSENLYLAFKKLKHYFDQNNEWYNPVEFSTYEANLATNLYKLLKGLENESYVPHPLEVLPFPKKNSNNEERIRQYFRPHLEDQIVWIAITNVIGQYAEEKMPAWSFGNRLFRPSWTEYKADKKEVSRGSYSNNSSNYYRNWSQSWPYYRRHIALAVKVMGFNKSFRSSDILEGQDRKVFEQDISDKGNFYYLDMDFWPEQKVSSLFWAGLDFKDFFPSLSADIVIENLRKVLVRNDGSPRDDIELVMNTVSRMMKNKYMKQKWLSDNLNVLSLQNNGEFNGVPTGILAAGFLANVAMFEVDQKIEDYVKLHKNVAIFKYVDDHTILSYSKEALVDFLNFYHTLLKDFKTGLQFHPEKVLPSKSFIYDLEKGFIPVRKSGKDECELDIEYPEPLMTMTLEKMSNLNDEDYDLLDNKGLEKSQEDLSHLLLADFPDAEIKRETRMSFAAMKLCQIGFRLKPDFHLTDKSFGFNIPQSFYDEEIKKIQRKHLKVHKLILKAAKDNPDKLKLWKRSLEYCFYTCAISPGLVFEEIKKTELHPLGKHYLQGYCMMVYNHLLLRAYNKITSSFTSYWEQYTSRSFLNQSIDWIEVLRMEASSFQSKFVIETINNFNVISSFTKCDISYNNDGRFGIHFNNDELGLNPENPAQQDSFHQYLWYFLSNLNENQKLRVWEKYVQAVSLSNKISWGILSFYPNQIPANLINQFRSLNDSENKLLERYDFAQDATGIVYEIFNDNPDALEGNKDLYPTLYSIFNQPQKDYVKLDDWIDFIKDTTMKSNWIDPRYSEWTQLEIIKQISQSIINESSSNSSTDFFNLNEPHTNKVHPANYLVPIQWKKLKNVTWHSWKRKVRKYPVKMQNRDFLVEDHRYLPLTKFWKHGYMSFLFGSQEFSLIVGLSVLLVKLLSRSFKWPSSSNKIAFIDQLYTEIQTTLETQPISSELRILLVSIFSKRELDLFSGNYRFTIDGERIVGNLNDYLNQLSAIQKKLERGQLDLYNELPRQLTYIDLDMLNRSKSIL